MKAWGVVALVGVGTAALKASGPMMLTGRRIPPRVRGMMVLLTPALLSALVVNEVLRGDGGIVLDERLVGLAAAGAAVVLRAPMVVVAGVAALATALVRLVA